jgi:hypothetical protein
MVASKINNYIYHPIQINDNNGEYLISDNLRSSGWMVRMASTYSRFDTLVFHKKRKYSSVGGDVPIDSEMPMPIDEGELDKCPR